MPYDPVLLEALCKTIAQRVAMGDEYSDVTIDPHLQDRSRQATLFAARWHWVKDRSSEENERSSALEINTGENIYIFHLSWVGPFYRVGLYKGNPNDVVLDRGWTDVPGHSSRGDEKIGFLVEFIENQGFMELSSGICEARVAEICQGSNVAETIFEALFCE